MVEQQKVELVHAKHLKAVSGCASASKGRARERERDEGGERPKGTEDSAHENALRAGAGARERVERNAPHSMLAAKPIDAKSKVRKK